MLGIVRMGPPQAEGESGELHSRVAGDFMYWPTGKHRLGWFVRPKTLFELYT